MHLLLSLLNSFRSLTGMQAKTTPHNLLRYARLVIATMAISAAAAAANTVLPDLQMGCLYSKNLTVKMRVCNSEDPVEAVGVYCRVPTVAYGEIRIAPGNWDSVSHAMDKSISKLHVAHTAITCMFSLALV